MWLQVSENAKQDLKDGLRLYNTDNNIGLRNAWNIIQAEVCGWVQVWYTLVSDSNGGSLWVQLVDWATSYPQLLSTKLWKITHEALQ